MGYGTSDRGNNGSWGNGGGSAGGNSWGGGAGNNSNNHRDDYGSSKAGGYGGGGNNGGGYWRDNGRKAPVKASFAPARGGGEWGKKMRQQQQEAMKDAKSNRESDYFWERQEQLARHGPPRGRAGRQEEQELYASTSHSVGIDFDKYDGIHVEVSGHGADEITSISVFDDLWARYELPDFLWENIRRCKYMRPTPIQKHAIPVALCGRDAMCCAQTGSGKTCAFLVPILSCIDTSQATGSMGVDVGEPAAPKALVLAPTRELCSQIHLEARKLSFGSPVRASEVYGGVDAKPQLLELARGSDIVTATPGRLTDFIDRRVITMSGVGYLVLDEADRMLDMGFEPQIREIVLKRDMPSSSEGRMTLMFSATFPSEIQKLARAFLRNYIWIGVGRVGGAADTVEQTFVSTGSRGKTSELLRVLRENPEDSTLIFVAMKRTAAWLEQHLHGLGLNARAIHGDMEQPQREASLADFRSGKCKLLVATDVAARGLDIPKVSHVVNYDLPGAVDDYVHRIGRTGRIGNRGWATSFYVPAAEGQHSNSNILAELIQTLTNAGQTVPEVLQKEADLLGVRRQAAKRGGGGGGHGRSFGGRDTRGGDWGAGGQARGAAPRNNHQPQRSGNNAGRGGRGGGGGGGGKGGSVNGGWGGNRSSNNNHWGS